MTGIYGNSQEDRIRERELEKHLRQKAERGNKKLGHQAPQANYKFPEYLNNNINFVQLVKFMNYKDISRFVYFVGIMADEKEALDCRHFASDQLNSFLNELLNRGEL